MKLAKSILIIALFSALLHAQDSVQTSFESKTPGVTFETTPMRAAVSQKTATDLIAQGCIELGVLTLTTPDLKQDLTPAMLKEVEGRQGDTVILHDSVNASETAYKQKCAEKVIVDGPPAYDKDGQFRPTRVLQCDRYVDDYSKPFTVYVRRTSAQVFRCSYDRARYAELHARLLKEKAAADRLLRPINERIQRNPKSGEAFRQRAEFYNTHNDHKLALQDYSKAIELDQTDVEAWRGRARTYLRIGDSAGARIDYDKVVELNRLDMEAVEAVAKLCVDTEYNCRTYYGHVSDLKKINELSEQIRREPGNRQALMERAKAYNNQYYPHEYGRALQDYNAVLRLYPTDTDALEGRAEAYHGTGDHASEMADYNELIRREPTNVERLLDRAFGYHLHHDYAHAIQDYTEVLRRDPTNSSAFYWRSDTYKDLGDKRLAKKDMKEYDRLQKQRRKKR